MDVARRSWRMVRRRKRASRASVRSTTQRWRPRRSERSTPRRTPGHHIEHGREHLAVVAVGAARLEAQRRAAGTGGEVPLHAGAAAVGGVRADLRGGRRAPPFAGIEALSIEARLRSSASAAASRSRSTRCSSPSTPFGPALGPVAGRPSPCQSRSRRQQGLPRTPIRGHARATERLPRQPLPADARPQHEHDALERPSVTALAAARPSASEARGAARAPPPPTARRSQEAWSYPPTPHAQMGSVGGS